MSKRSSRRNAARGNPIAPSNGNGFRARAALLPEVEAKRLLELGAAVFAPHEVELLANTAIAIAQQTGTHPARFAAVLGAGVVADMVTRSVRAAVPQPGPDEPLPPVLAALLDSLGRGLHAGRLAEEARKQGLEEERTGKPVEDGEDIVLRARKSGLVIAN